jgi:tRNA (adenine22-N1)-methyltransferase
LRTALKPRLRAVAEAVPAGAAVVDVGAGDGQLSVWLAAEGHRVIATEGRAGPYVRLRARLERYGVETRPADGLSAVQVGEVDVAVIAGVGGHRIVRILAASPQVVAALRALVLQPVQHADVVRSWIRAAGLEVVEETQAVEAGRRYTVLLVKGARDGSG